MTPQPPPAERNLADIFAEAEEANAKPVVEPFVLTLHSGKKVTFRDPDQITTQEWAEADAVGGLRGRLMAYCADVSQFRALWREVKDVPPNRIGALADTVVEYYERAGKAAGTTTPSKRT